MLFDTTIYNSDLTTALVKWGKQRHYKRGLNAVLILKNKIEVLADRLDYKNAL